MEQNRIFERLAAFEGWLHENGRAMGTREKYLRDVRAFAVWAGGRSLTQELALAWREHLPTRCKAISVNSMLAAVNSFLRFAGRDELRRSAKETAYCCLLERTASRNRHAMSICSGRRSGDCAGGWETNHGTI